MIAVLPARYGSPTVEEIKSFSRTLSRQLDEAVTAGTMRADFALEVRNASESVGRGGHICSECLLIWRLCTNEVQGRHFGIHFCFEVLVCV